jgi:hypothetical protein
MLFHDRVELEPVKHTAPRALDGSSRIPLLFWNILRD